MKLIKSEPAMTAAVVVSLVLATLIFLGKLELADVSEFVETFGAVLLILGPLFLGGWVRSKVTPVGKG